MRIKIIQIGKVKDTYLKEGENQFLKRLSPYAKIEILNLKDENSVKLDDTFLVVMDEQGKEMNSKDFAKFLEDFKDSGQTVNFVVGGAYGFSNQFKKKANLLLSLSKMTFTHQMARLFLIEQIYRGLSIIAGKEYHHDQ